MRLPCENALRCSKRNNGTFRARPATCTVILSFTGVWKRFGTAIAPRWGQSEGYGWVPSSVLPSRTPRTCAYRTTAQARLHTCLTRCAAYLFNARKSLCEAAELVTAALYDVLLLARKLHQVPLEGAAVVV